MVNSDRPNPVGRPKRIASDEEVAARLLDELRMLGDQHRDASARRVRVALAAREVGVTNAEIAEALGVTPAAISKWANASRHE